MRQQDRGWWVALLALVLIVLVLPVLGGGMMGWGMMGPGMMGWPGAAPVQGAAGWGWGLATALGVLAMLAFWGAVIVGIVLAGRALSRPGYTGSSSREDVALDILKQRYAAGQLTGEQYEGMRRVLAQ